MNQDPDWLQEVERAQEYGEKQDFDYAQNGSPVEESTELSRYNHRAFGFKPL